MPANALRRALHLRPSSPAHQLPASVSLGLALPAAILGIVLIGMDLHLAGMLVWTAAVVLVGAALRGWHAIGAIGALAWSGVMLWRFVLGGATVLSNAEQMALALLTVLGGVVGQLIVREMKQRDRAAAARLQLDVFASAIESILDASRDCIKLLGTDGTLLSINEAGVKLVGAESAEQILGKSWLALWGAEHQKLLGAAWHQVLTRGHAQFEGSCRILSGERRNWHNSFTLVRTPTQSQACVICISSDVTETSAMRETLNSSVAQLSALLNNIDDVSLAIDNNWIIRFANRSGEQLCESLERPNAVGRSLWEIFPSARSEPSSILMRRAMEEKSEQRFEYFFAQRRIWFGITVFPSANGISMLARDISQLKRASKTAAEEAARLQVAHEIAGFGDWGFDYNEGAMQFSARALAMLEMEECPPHDYKKYLLDKLSARDRMALIRAIVNCTEAEPTLDLLVRLPARDGSEKHLHWIGRLLTDERGNAARMLGAIQDVSEHLHVQHSLEKARSLVRDLVDVLPQQIIVVDKAGRVVIANQTWLETRKQYYRSDETPVNFFELGEGEEDNRVIIARARQAVRAILDEAEDCIEYEYSVDRGAGLQYFFVHARPLRNDTELLAVLVHQEITSLKQASSIAADAIAQHLPAQAYN